MCLKQKAARVAKAVPEGEGKKPQLTKLARA